MNARPLNFSPPDADDYGVGSARAASPHPLLARLADERGIVVSFFVRLTILLAILGTLLVDAGAVVFSRLQVQDIAESAATAGAATYRTTRNVKSAMEDAKLRIADKSRTATLTAFNVLPDGSVQVSVKVPASTVFFHRFDVFEDVVVATGRAVARPPTV